MAAHVLMLSSSRQGDEDYLDHARAPILAHLGERRELLFIPFAGITMSWDEYVEKVQAALPECKVTGIHCHEDPVAAVKEALSKQQAIVVGGGNTFNLITELNKQQLMQPIRDAINAGTPYIGWSAGANICGASIRTTNDMPIIEPPSFNALHVLNCQINPHYTDVTPPGHNGETRDQRLFEFTTLNPQTPVIAIREGTALVLSNDSLTFYGEHGGYVFLGQNKQAIGSGDVLTQYIS